jgi:hypothetical protein
MLKLYVPDLDTDTEPAGGPGTLWGAISAWIAIFLVFVVTAIGSVLDFIATIEP